MNPESKELKKRHFIGEGALLLVTLLWGATFVIVKESLRDISPMLFIALRFLIAAVLLLPLSFNKFKFADKGFLKAAALLGAFLFLGFAFQTVGLNYTTATKSGFITGSVVVFVPIFQTFIEKRPPGKGSIIGILLVTIGILFLSSGGNSLSAILTDLGGDFNLGDLLTLNCAVFYAVYIVFLDIYSKKYDFLLLSFFQILITSMLGFISAVFLGISGVEATRIELTGYLIFGLIYVSVFATLITMILQTRYQKEVTPTKAGIIYSFEPIFAALFAFFMLSEKITNFGIV